MELKTPRGSWYRQHSVPSLHLWSHRLAWPRTEPSQGSDTGSNPVGTTTVSPLLDSDLAILQTESGPHVPLSVPL